MNTTLAMENVSSVSAGGSEISYSMLNSPLSVMERVFVGMGVSGALLNLLVIVVFSVYGSLLSGSSATARYLILHQSVLDMMSSLALVLNQYYGGLGSRGAVIPASITSGQWLYCRLIWSTHITWTFMCASTFNLELLTIERYASIIHPVWHRNKVAGKNKRALLVVCSLLWVLGFADPLGSLFFSTIYIPEKHQCALVGLGYPGDQIVVILTLALALFIFPLIIMGYCYGRILYRVYNAVADAGGTQGAANNRNKKLAQTCAMIAGVYVVCYAPNNITFTQYAFGGPLDPTWYTFTVALTFTNCLCNPLIYTWKMPEFRRGLGKLFLAVAVRLGAVDPAALAGTSVGGTGGHTSAAA